MQLGKPDRTPKGEVGALLLDGQRRRTGPPAAGAADQLTGTASSPGAAGPAGSPDPVPGRDVATGCASMARGGRHHPGLAWPAAADPDGVPGTAERRAAAGVVCR